MLFYGSLVATVRLPMSHIAAGINQYCIEVNLNVVVVAVAVATAATIPHFITICLTEYNSPFTTALFSYKLAIFVEIFWGSAWDIGFRCSYQRLRAVTLNSKRKCLCVFWVCSL